MNKVENVNFEFRVKQLKGLCEEYLKNNSDEFYSKEEKALIICKISMLMIEQANKEF